MEDLKRRIDLIERNGTREKFLQRLARQPVAQQEGQQVELPQSNIAAGTISAAHTGPPPGTGLWNQVNPTQANESTSTSSPSTARTWNTADTNTPAVVPENVPLWTSVVQNGTQRTQLLDNRQQQRNGRRGPGLHGASGENRLGQARSLSADVDIVAYNFGKNVTAVDVSNWLATKGVEVKDCKLFLRL